MKKTIYPSWQSVKRPLSFFAVFFGLFILGGLYCMAESPRGLNFHSAMIIVSLPVGLVLVPICILFSSFRIKISDEDLVFYMFFIPVRSFRMSDIKDIKYEKFSNRGQPCVLTVVCAESNYSFPVRLFRMEDVHFVIQFTLEKNQIVSPKSGDVMSESIFFSKGKYDKQKILNVGRYLLSMILIISIVIIFHRCKS